jgi:hypothetical protein
MRKIDLELLDGLMAEQDAGGGDESGGEPPRPPEGDEGGSDDGGDDKGDSSSDDDPWADPEKARAEIEKLRKENAKRRTAGKQTKAELDELRKAKEKLDALEREQMDDQEKLRADLEKAQARAAQLEQQAAETAALADHRDRMRYLATQGVAGDSAQDYIAQQLGAAMSEQGDDFDRDQWVAKFKAENPAFFGSTQSPRGGAGGPAGGAGREQRIAELDQRMSSIRNSTRNDHALERVALMREKRKLQGG